MGNVTTVGFPNNNESRFTIVTDIRCISSLATQDAGKKADIYVNGSGLSLKQTGGSFSFNRLQRANIADVFRLLNFGNIDERMQRIDQEVQRFHNGSLDCRNRPWRDFFSEVDFFHY